MSAQPVFTALPVPPALLGESPFWHPDEAALYWVDIPGRALHRWEPAASIHRQWAFETEPGCCAPIPGGDLLLAMRDGLWRFNPDSGERKLLAPAPFDPAQQRFNDGKADPQGRFWVGTIHEPRDRAAAALYRYDGTTLEPVAGDITVSNGLAWSPDGATMLWADTAAHRVHAFDFDGGSGNLARQRVFADFPRRIDDATLDGYGGRPDGAAVDSDGTFWIAMFEGQRLVRLAPDGTPLQDLPLPVRCATMPCFGGPDLKTLYLTTARYNRPAAELAVQPWAGCVLSLQVDVPGLPVNFVRL